MPRRATTPEKAQEAPTDPYEGLSDDGHNEFAQELIADAVALQEEKKELLKRVDTNRTTLRLVVDTGHVSEKQAKFAELTYPPRKSKDDTDTAQGENGNPAPDTPNAA